MLIISFIEGIIVTVILLSIPPDPKNAFLFGYSKSRLLILAAVLVLLSLIGVSFFNKKLRTRFGGLLASASPLARILPWVGGVMMLLLWLTIWIPAYRFEEGAAGFTRLQPLLIWIELLVVQVALASWAVGGLGNFRATWREAGSSRKLLRIGIGLYVITTLVFIILFVAGGEFSGRQLYFPPGAPLSGLQVILAWLAFFVMLRIEQTPRPGKSTSRWMTFVLVFLIWAAAFATWTSIPIPCTDDRPGPYPPNNVCYPNVNDAVYSIGSHYITLGQGVYNHWLTDKPLYMAFLALGQAVAGPVIDNYLVFQVAVIALLPALLFLAGRRKIGVAFGVFLALLAVLQGAYAISLYREVGSVNVKLENPEVLTALFLLVFSFAAFKWLSHPTDSRWAILSGGILGLTVLLRFNPLFILPFLVMAVFIAGKRLFKKVLITVLFFGLAFTVAFGPWFLSAKDPEGRNHYLTKIEEVISSRFSSRQDALTPVIQSDPAAPATETQTSEIPADREELLYYGLGEIDKAGASGVFYHFLNNLYSGLAKLPTSLVLHPIREQVTGGIWAFTGAQPIWKTGLRAENLFAMGINLALVLAGILTAWKRFGFAGLTGVVVVLGNYTGNAFSQTSGGRYLEPVFWVLILYFCLGIYTLTQFGIKAFSRETLDWKEDQPVVVASIACGGRRWVTPMLLAAFLLSGLILPGLNLLPDVLPAESDSSVEVKAYEVLSQRGLVGGSEWHTFLQDPDHILRQGRAYHPRYYRGSFYRPGNLSFEVMVLSKGRVLVGYSPRMMPGETFSDGSDVILVGCRIGRDTLWAARRIIVESIAVIQLDNEGSLLFDENKGWDCSR